MSERLAGILVSSFTRILIPGIKVTIPLTLLSFVFGCIIALFLALVQIANVKGLKQFARFYIWVFRGTPLIVQLFIIFFGLPSVGIILDAFPSAVIAFALNLGAYNAEIFRSAIQAVPEGQTEAAYMVGLSYRQTMTRIVMPQAFRIAFPPLFNSLIGLTKDTSLASSITVVELFTTAQQIAAKVGADEYLDFNVFEAMVDEACAALKLKLSTPERKQVLNAVSWRDPRAAKVIKKQHKLSGSKLKDLLSELQTTAEWLGDYGYWPSTKAGEFVEYEPDSELRDTENVPLAKSKTPTASSVIHEYFIREVRPHVDEAWIALDKTVIGYEISFNKYFYQHKPLRSLEEVTAEILALEAETDGLLKQLVSFVSGAK